MKLYHYLEQPKPLDLWQPKKICNKISPPTFLKKWLEQGLLLHSASDTLYHHRKLNLEEQPLAPFLS